MDRKVYKYRAIQSFMYESRILKLKEVAVFSLADISQIGFVRGDKKNKKKYVYLL